MADSEALRRRTNTAAVANIVGPKARKEAMKKAMADRGKRISQLSEVNLPQERKQTTLDRSKQQGRIGQLASSDVVSKNTVQKRVSGLSGRAIGDVGRIGGGGLPEENR